MVIMLCIDFGGGGGGDNNHKVSFNILNYGYDVGQ
jgi:hypothetical protein